MIASKQLARMIAVYSYKSGIKSIDGSGGIAEAVGLPPLSIINAINAGEKMGLFTVKRLKKGGMKSISVSDDQYEKVVLVASNFGEALYDLCEAITEAVVNANEREEDLSRDVLMLWSGVSPLLFEAAITVLEAGPTIATYDIKDKTDKKSVYTFLTLHDNEHHRWGKKQFKK